MAVKIEKETIIGDVLDLIHHPAEKCAEWCEEF